MPPKRQLFVVPDGLEDLTRDITPDTSSDRMFEVIQDIRELCLQAKKLKLEKAPIKTLAASGLQSMGQVCGLTDIIFDEYSDDHFWELKPKPDEVEKFGTSWMKSALDDIRTSKTWNSNKCEALIRTTVDIILFDRMMLVANTEAARKLLIAGEYTVRTKCANKSTEIVGRVDYAMGYGREAPLLLDSPYIAIGIKTVENFSSAQHQLAAYLLGLQQIRRNEGKTVTVIYGIATDGLHFQFLRLGENCHLQMSDILSLARPAQRLSIWNFIDSILAAAMQIWWSSVEEKFFNLPTSVEDLLEAIDDDDIESEYKIELGGTPSRTTVKLVRKRDVTSED